MAALGSREAWQIAWDAMYDKQATMQAARIYRFRDSGTESRWDKAADAYDAAVQAEREAWEAYRVASGGA